jgi:hypothetical protein
MFPDNRIAKVCESFFLSSRCSVTPLEVPEVWNFCNRTVAPALWCQSLGWNYQFKPEQKLLNQYGMRPSGIYVDSPCTAYLWGCKESL